MLFTAWSNRDGTKFALCRGPGPPRLADGTADPGAEVALYTFEADSYNGAMAEYYRRQGWEPYRPMLRDDGTTYPEDEAPFAVTSGPG